MNVIDNLVFKLSIPNTDVIESILNVVTHRQIGDLQNIIKLEPRTVSLLLQLVFRNYTKAKNDDFLNNWFLKAESNKFTSSFEVALNFHLCVEESYSNELINKSNDEQLQLAHNVCQELLRDELVLEHILSDQSTLFKTEYLAYLAKLKFCLKILAKCSHSQEINDSINRNLFDSYTNDLRKLVEPTIQVTSTVFNFLVKEIIRKYGFGSFKYIINNQSLKWTIPVELNHNKFNSFESMISKLEYSILNSQSELIKPLADLIKTPRNFQQSFIPCMPQDILFDQLSALRKDNDENDNPTLYGICFSRKTFYAIFLIFNI